MMTKTFRARLSRAALGALLVTAVIAAQPALAASAEQPETVCIQCHGALPDRLGGPVHIWRKSIHSQNGISCNSCHGGDPKDSPNAMSKERGFLGVPVDKDIPAFCGRCHPGVLKDYLASAHGKALGQGGPTCVTCHGSHQVVQASLELINEKTCTQCHSFDRARIIRDAMQQTEASISGIDRRITKYQAEGADVERLAKGLFSVRNSFHSLFHEVNVERVTRESARINAELAKIDRDLKVIDDTRAKRKIAGGIAVFFLLVMALLVHLLKKTYD